MYNMTFGSELFFPTLLSKEEGYVSCAFCDWEGVGLSPSEGEFMLLRHLQEWHPNPVVHIEDLEGFKLT